MSEKKEFDKAKYLTEAESCEYWNFFHLAAVMHCSVDHARRRVVKRHGFPSRNAAGLFVAAEVKKWLNSNKTSRKSA